MSDHRHAPRLRTSPFALASLLTVVVSTGCASGTKGASKAPTSGPSESASTTSAPPRGTLAHSETDPHLWVYTSNKRGFQTNTYFIEGESAAVAIDTQFTPSAAREALALFSAEVNKPVELAVVLHANPDKFNGTRVFTEAGARVVTSSQVAALIPDVFALRTKWFGDRYAPDWPGRTPAPESFGETTTILEAAGLELSAHVLGAGCSMAHVAITWNGHLFAGDLVASGTHAWLELGKTAAWKARLDELAALSPAHVHPGRGPSGGPELVSAQRAYLERVDDIARSLLADRPNATADVDKDLVQQARSAVEAAYPDLGYTVFLRVGMPAVLKALAAAPAG